MKKQQTILITGASSGIGKATAIKLAQEGHKVFAGIRRKTDKAELEKAHKNITGVYIDVTNASSIDKAFWFVMKNTDKINVLINNAGIVVAGPVELLSLNRLKQQFEINTFGPIMVAQKFLPLLHGSKIINISSMAANGIFPYISAYCASKRALDIFFNSFNVENKDNIKVISVKPASIKTPIWNRSIEATRNSFEDLKETQKTKYEKELIFLEKNALENNFKGINVEKVTSTISKIVKNNNPKPSYNIGFSAHLAALASKLPICILNKLLKSKINKLK